MSVGATRAPGDGSGGGPGVDEQTLRARAYLSRVAEPACVPLWDFVRRVGPIEAAAAIAAGTAPAHVDAVTAPRRDRTDPGADLDAAERYGLRLVVPESAEWPHFALGALERTGAARAAAFVAGQRRPIRSGEPVPPLALWVRGPGELASLGVRAAGIVGSRAATPYGVHVTSELAFGLAGRDVVIVSGGAYGIDASAHRGALAAGGRSVIVAAGGLDRAYPPGNARLFEQVAQHGLLVSESPPGCAPHRHRFLTRNRLIAAFSTGIVVVEAARRSGALNTAGHCRALQRPLMAVPGSVDSPMSAGCHDLLRREGEAALLVTCAEDVLAVVGSIGEGLAPPGADAAAAPDTRTAALDLLDSGAQRVFDGLLTRRFCGPDEIATRSGVRVVEVLQALPELELAGLVESVGGQYRVAGRRRASAK